MLGQLRDNAIFPADQSNDSGARFKPPNSRPHARFEAIKIAEAWYRDPNQERGFLWIHGARGVGKSAIVRHIMASGLASGDLDAVFSVIIPSGHDDPRPILSSISHQICERYPWYLASVAELFTRRSDLFERTVSEQFELLISRPFDRETDHGKSTTSLVVIDGLDKLSEETTIIRCIAEFTATHPSSSLVWAISTDSDPQLLLNGDLPSSYREAAISAASDPTAQHIEKDIYGLFRRVIAKFYVTTPSWPPYDQFLKILIAATGCTDFIKHAFKFLQDPWISHPQSQLLCLNNLLDEFMSNSAESSNAPLDMLRLQVFRRIPPDILGTTQRFLVGCKLSWSSLATMCNALHITQDEAYSFLQYLHPLMKIPPAEEAYTENISPRESLLEFLTDSSRSGQYALEEDNAYTNDLWDWVCRILKAACDTGEGGSTRQ